VRIFTFVTHGDGQIGIGHLIRCFYIAEWLKKILIKDIKIQYLILDSGDCELAKTIINDRKDRDDIIEITNFVEIATRKFDCLIVDMLDVDENVIKKLKNISNRLISIDNTSKSRCHSDVCINPLYYDVYSCMNPPVDFIGPHYHINSPKLFDKTINFNSQVENILIMQGGSDPLNNLERISSIIEDVIKTYPEITFNFLIGPAYSHPKEWIFNLMSKYENINSYENEVDVLKIYSKMDLAISSVGISALEIASLGIPSIHFTRVKKEKKTATYIQKLGLSIFVNDSNENHRSILVNEISEMIVNKEKRFSMHKLCKNYFNIDNTTNFIRRIIN